MRTPHPTRTLGAAGLLLALVVAGCAGEPSGAGPSGAGATSQAAGASAAEASQILSRYDLGGLGAVDAIDRLDRLAVADRPAGLMASVRPRELQLSGNGRKATLPISGARFYLSVAPYVTRTHDCFYHSLTTCKGELSGTAVHVKIVDERGAVLVDADRTTFANGFVGFWLPRDVRGTVTVTADGRSGDVPFATDSSAPTCLTTLRLA